MAQQQLGRMTKITAIPTVYNGTNFRSKLEARWAIVFDALGWTWEYEPAIPLAGYIPDFLLRVELRRHMHARPQASPFVLVEAKPIVEAADYIAPVRKIALSSWSHAALILCPTLERNCVIGLGTDRPERRDATDTGYLAWHPVSVTEDGAALQFGNTGKDLTELWRKAGNSVQWCPRVTAP